MVKYRRKSCDAVSSVVMTVWRIKIVLEVLSQKLYNNCDKNILEVRPCIRIVSPIR